MTIAGSVVVVVVGRSAAVGVTPAVSPAGADGTSRRGADRTAGLVEESRTTGPESSHRPHTRAGQSRVQTYRFQVPRIGETRYPRYRVHRPVEAQGARTEKHPRAGRRQVQKGQAPRQPRRVPRRRVVGAREFRRRRTADLQSSDHEEKQATGQYADATIAGPASASFLKMSNETPVLFRRNVPSL